jgi:hypothetical protein
MLKAPTAAFPAAMPAAALGLGDAEGARATRSWAAPAAAEDTGLRFLAAATTAVAAARLPAGIETPQAQA